ncbi:prolyl oligopeptidase family serine peptidase [Nonomuraea roseoviolacea]|uniref:prolyl oligopeptidase n=1 Tax=Nonomuraea roseoviolacea subsp. carminata TaxID=160689 RepID=A0ABT1KBL5_9ACTN|nr:prolyl oligopeptidase family serine peptidase [Nonomuraea roseoviolacea]MCP2350374.1 prolyl oligopeptidase [Nonomuraea roseoviolacea subsp. carminata]
MKYPDAPRLPHIDHLHGHEVADPYRWLEDPATSGTRAWQQAQDRLWREHAAALPLRDRFEARLMELSAAGLVTPPLWRGGRRFHLAQSAGQEHPVLHLDGVPVLDPSALDPSGLTTLDGWQPDHDGRLLAYQVSRRGDERADLLVLDLDTGRPVDGPIGGCRYSPVAWLPGGDAFYYVRFRRGVYLHRLGDPADVEVFTRGAVAYGLQTSGDGRWLTITAGTRAGNGAWLADLSAGDPARLDPRPVHEAGRERDARTEAAVGPDGRLYVLTDQDAPRRRLCVADPAEPSAWKELIPEDGAAVLGAFTVLDGDRLLVARTRHAVGEIGVHDAATGERLAEVPLPGSGTVTALTARPDGGHEAWFGYTDAVTPAEVWRYDARDGAATRWATAPGHVPFTEVESRHVEYTSADGTRVRMVVSALPGRDGPRPAILTGYGGFGVPLTPAYAADSRAWVEAGGVLAVAQLRGGGEEGESWHRDGMLGRKQNVFADFEAAAEKLVADGWTEPGRLAAWGESNGGLLVGAALTRRPDLFAAVICSAGLLDMVRYERSGLGASWATEYGTAADPEQLAWLLGYSPYHHVREGVAYPATLFTVSGGDSRVDPMHARKMCAALQAATTGEGPVLLRHDPDVGHGARAVSRSVALAADVLAFAAAHTGLTPTTD